MKPILDKLNHFFDIFAIFSPPDSTYWNDNSYQRWLSDGCHGLKSYMAREGRGEIERVFPAAKSVIVVAKSYRDNVRRDGVALFACGEDYHVAIKRELGEVLDVIKREYSGAKGRAVVDTAPIFEKALAHYGGLGWVGRNSLIVNEKLGSYFNIGVLFVDVELEEVRYEVGGSCGDCRACLDGCSMGAIRDDYMIDAKSCISYLNFELPRPTGTKVNPINGWTNCCDDCQICCPYNLERSNNSSCSTQSPHTAKGDL